MLRYQQQFDFFDNEAINRSVRFVSLSEDAMSGDLDRGARAHRRRGQPPTTRGWSSSTRSARWSSPARTRQPEDQPAAVRAAAGHADDELAGHHLPDRRILQRDRRQPGVHGGRRPDLAAPERAAQLHGAQDGDHEDARPAHACRACTPSASTTAGVRVFAPAQVVAAGSRRARRAVHGERALHGRAGARRDARRRPAARLLAAGGRAFGVGQEHPGRVLPGRRRALRRDRRGRRLRAAPQPGAQSACSST